MATTVTLYPDTCLGEASATASCQLRATYDAAGHLVEAVLVRACVHHADLSLDAAGGAIVYQENVNKNTTLRAIHHAAPDLLWTAYVGTLSKETQATLALLAQVGQFTPPLYRPGVTVTPRYRGNGNRQLTIDLPHLSPGDPVLDDLARALEADPAVDHTVVTLKGTS